MENATVWQSAGSSRAARARHSLRARAGCAVNALRARLRGVAATRRKPRLPKADRSPLPNRLRRDFSTGAMNRSWAADLTYIRTAEGWLFLAVVLDLGSRRVIGWAMGARPDTDLVLRA